jgi:hypothetical protein
MLKKIALVGVFALTSFVSVASGTASSRTEQKDLLRPTTPTPQGWGCGGGTGMMKC